MRERSSDAGRAEAGAGFGDPSHEEVDAGWDDESEADAVVTASAAPEPLVAPLSARTASVLPEPPARAESVLPEPPTRAESVLPKPPLRAESVLPDALMRPELPIAEPDAVVERTPEPTVPPASVLPSWVAPSVAPEPVHAELSAPQAFESLSPLELDEDAFSPRARFRPALRRMSLMAAGGALLALGAVWFSSSSSARSTAVETVPAVAAPAVQPAPVRSAASPESSASHSKFASAFASALSGSSVSVNVQVRPEGAWIFHEDKRLGRSSVTIKVEPGKKKILLALRDGYLPQRIAVDASSKELAVDLVRAPKNVPERGASAR